MGSSVYMGTAQDFIASMHRKKDIIARLCAALHEFLSFDIDHIIEQAARPLPKPRRPTIEDLNRAQEEVDISEGQIEALERLAEQMPEAMREVYLEWQKPMLQRFLEPMKQRVAMIQKAMEEPEADPSSPWDGSRRIGTLCANCASDFEEYADSPKALHPKLESAGWRRGRDGDWLCPACYATEVDSRATQSPEPAPETSTTQQERDQQEMDAFCEEGERRLMENME